MKYSELIAKIQERAILNQRYNINTDFDIVNDGLNHFFSSWNTQNLSSIVSAERETRKITNLLRVTEAELKAPVANFNNLSSKILSSLLLTELNIAEGSYLSELTVIACQIVTDFSTNNFPRVESHCNPKILELYNKYFSQNKITNIAPKLLDQSPYQRINAQRCTYPEFKAQVQTAYININVVIAYFNNKNFINLKEILEKLNSLTKERMAVENMSQLLRVKLFRFRACLETSDFFNWARNNILQFPDDIQRALGILVIALDFIYKIQDTKSPLLFEKSQYISLAQSHSLDEKSKNELMAAASSRIGNTWRNRYQTAYGPFMLDRAKMGGDFDKSIIEPTRLFHVKLNGVTGSPTTQGIVEKWLRASAFSTRNYYDLLLDMSDKFIDKMLLDIKLTYNQNDIDKFIQRICKTKFLLKHYNKLENHFFSDKNRLVERTQAPTQLANNLVSLSLLKRFLEVNTNNSMDQGINNYGFVFFHIQPEGYDVRIASRFGEIEYCVPFNETFLSLQGYVSVTEQCVDVMKNDENLLDNPLFEPCLQDEKLQNFRSKNLQMLEYDGRAWEVRQPWKEDGKGWQFNKVDWPSFSHEYTYQRAPGGSKTRMRYLLEEGFFGPRILKGIACSLLRELALINLPHLNEKFVTGSQSFTDAELGLLMKDIVRLEAKLPNIVPLTSKWRVRKYASRGNDIEYEKMYTH